MVCHLSLVPRIEACTTKVRRDNQMQEVLRGTDIVPGFNHTGGSHQTPDGSMTRIIKGTSQTISVDSKKPNKMSTRRGKVINVVAFPFTV
jgi:hypothetical protein